MSPLARGLVIALVQVLIVGAVGGKLLYDRQTLPRAWVPTTGVDPMLPIRGRYVSLFLVVDNLPPPDEGENDRWQRMPASFRVEDGRLTASLLVGEEADRAGFQAQAVVRVGPPDRRVWAVADPIAFFLPEEGPDPSVLKPGQTLWAEVSVPEGSTPRPIRLEIRE